jgi:Anti-sigma-28 factor, FlgM
LEKDHLGSPDLIEAVNLKKLENLKDAVSNGTYAVRAEDLAPKLLEHLFQFLLSPGAPIEDSSSRLESEADGGSTSPAAVMPSKTSSRE